jgi:uncharacterized protein (TIGR03086 family)
MNDTTQALHNDDPRAVFAAAVSAVRTTAEHVGPQQLHQPTPCGDFDVQELLEHLSVVLPRVAALGAGANPFEIGPALPAPGQSWSDAWLAVAHEIQQLWSDPAILERPMSLPWVQTNGAGMMAQYTAELTVHTWDLARATGQQVDLDPRAVDTALRAYEQVLPADGRRAGFEAIAAQMPPDARPANPPFGERHETRSNAGAIERLVAWTGRDPGWSGAN